MIGTPVPSLKLKAHRIFLILKSARVLANDTYCAARGFEPIREYVDVGQSGGKESRPELNRLMEDARKRRFDAIVVWRFDRFASLNQAPASGP